jgi:hypothetical protein
MHAPVLFFSLLERKILTFIFKLPNSGTESHGNEEILSSSSSYELSEENKCLLAVTIIIFAELTFSGLAVFVCLTVTS